MKSYFNRKFDRVMRKLDKIECKLEGLKTMSAETDKAVQDLTDEVAAVKTADDAAVVLINSIPGLMASAGVPPATIATLTASLKTNSQPLLDAIAAQGTQSAPPGPIITTPPVVTPPVTPPATTPPSTTPPPAAPLAHSA